MPLRGASVTRAGVPAGVCARTLREQVVDDLAQPVAVAEHGRRLELEVERPRRARPRAPSRPPRRRARRARPARARAAGPRRAARAAAGRRRARSCARTRALIPRIERARSSGRSSAPRAKSSAYARTAASGVRSSCDASATKRRSRARGLARVGTRLDLAEHRVQREPEPADLGRVVGALDAVREVAGGDRGGRRARSPRAAAGRGGRPRGRAAATPRARASVTSSSIRSSRCSVASTS